MLARITKGQDYTVNSVNKIYRDENGCSIKYIIKGNLDKHTEWTGFHYRISAHPRPCQFQGLWISSARTRLYNFIKLRRKLKLPSSPFFPLLSVSIDISFHSPLHSETKVLISNVSSANKPSLNALLVSRTVWTLIFEAASRTSLYEAKTKGKIQVQWQIWYVNI
jgi:hypothetical protein